MKAAKSLFIEEKVLPQIKFIRYKKQEYVISLSFDSARRLIKRRVVTIGLLNTSLIHPREIYAGPLKDRAAMVVIVHNHPSDKAQPSFADFETTQQLVSAGQILGVPLHDHIIVTRKRYYSFRRKGYIL